MVFSSLTFLFLFLPIVLTMLSLCRNTPYQNIILFLSSLFFYAWGGVKFTLLLLASILLNHVSGLMIQRKSKHQRLVMIIAVALNLALLAFFKYANFLVDNFNILSGVFGISPVTIQTIVLPVGISFYTFQGISYLTDVYRGSVEAQRNFIRLDSYIASFPQLIAGHIIRYHDIEPQLIERAYTFDNLYVGLQRFTLGLILILFGMIATLYIVCCYLATGSYNPFIYYRF